MSSSEPTAEVPAIPGRAGALAWFLIVAGYPTIWWLAAWVIAGGDDHAYAEFVTATSLVLAMTIPAAIAAAFVAAVISSLGWWAQVLVETRRVDDRHWWLAGAIGVVAATQLALGHLLDRGAGYVLVAVVTCAAVATGSELLLRGVVLEHARRRHHEGRAASVTALTHVAMTASFFLLETPVTLMQLVALACLGDVWYLLRRVSGSAFAPAGVEAVLLFGLWSSRWGQPQRADVWDLLGAAALVATGVAATVMRRRLEPAAETTRRRIWSRVALGVAAALALILAAMVVPVSSRNLDAHPEPTGSFEEAVTRFETIVDAERSNGVLDQCRSRLLDHGHATEVTVVLFHGLTNCPRQFVELGRELQANGANVLILRAPHHGLEGAPDEIGGVGKVGSLSAQELRDYADDAVDIAAGLGDDVRVLGLSMGGVVAMWTAQHREVDRVVAVAPAVSVPRVPHVATTALINLATRLPNVSLPSSGVELDHTYSGESTGALASMFLLAQANENELTRRRSAADEVVVVLNPDDDQVDFDAVRELVSHWDDADGPVEVVTLPATGLPHDVIDVAQPTGDTDVVYPLLIDLLERAD